MVPSSFHFGTSFTLSVCFTVICFTRIFMECQEWMQNKRTEQEKDPMNVSLLSPLRVTRLFKWSSFSLVVQDKSSAMTRDTIKEITGQWENMSLCLLVFSCSLLHVIAWFGAKQISLLNKEVPSDCFSLPNFLSKKRAFIDSFVVVIPLNPFLGSLLVHLLKETSLPYIL